MKVEYKHYLSILEKMNFTIATILLRNVKLEILYLYKPCLTK